MEASLAGVTQHLPEEGRASYSAAETAYSVVARAYALEDSEDEVGGRHRSWRREVVAYRLGMGMVVDRQIHLDSDRSLVFVAWDFELLALHPRRRR